MGSHAWILLRASEDGNPITWLSDDELQGLLDEPSSYRVSEFKDPDELPMDPNYWPPNVAVLLRAETVIPVPAGIFKLPVGWDD